MFVEFVRTPSRWRCGDNIARLLTLHGHHMYELFSFIILCAEWRHAAHFRATITLYHPPTTANIKQRYINAASTCASCLCFFDDIFHRSFITRAPRNRSPFMHDALRSHWNSLRLDKGGSLHLRAAVSTPTFPICVYWAQMCFDTVALVHSLNPSCIHAVLKFRALFSAYVNEYLVNGKK